jgi:hypothetical protein
VVGDGVGGAATRGIERFLALLLFDFLERFSLGVLKALLLVGEGDENVRIVAEAEVENSSAIIMSG